MKRYRGILKSDIAPDDVNTIWIDSSTDAYQIKVFEKDHWITPDAQTMQKVNTLILAANQTLQEAKTKAAAAETKANEAAQKATAAESSASTASTAATAAQSALASTVTKVDQIKAAIEALPDGQAVSATVAEHTVKITNLESEVSDLERKVGDVGEDSSMAATSRNLATTYTVMGEVGEHFTYGTSTYYKKSDALDVPFSAKSVKIESYVYASNPPYIGVFTDDDGIILGKVANPNESTASADTFVEAEANVPKGATTLYINCNGRSATGTLKATYTKYKAVAEEAEKANEKGDFLMEIANEQGENMMMGAPNYAYINSSSLWKSGSNSYPYYCYRFAVNAGDRFFILTSNNPDTAVGFRYAWLKSNDTAEANSTAQFCTGCSLTTIAKLNERINLVAPDDAAFLYIYCSIVDATYGYACIPQKVLKIGGDKSEINWSVGMFRSMGVIGHSRDDGSIYMTKTSATYKQRKDLSWSSNLCRRNGINYHNFAYYGTWTKEWLQRADCKDAMLAEEACDLYYLGLGSNDTQKGTDPTTGEVNPTAYLGTIADIHDGNPDANADTFYGNYGRIVELVKGHAPNAKIVFAMTRLTQGGNYPEIRQSYFEAVKAIASHYGCPFIDWSEDEWYTRTRQLEWGYSKHPTAIMHTGISYAFERLFSKCVEKNYDYFADYYNGSVIVPDVVRIDALENNVDDIAREYVDLTQFTTYKYIFLENLKWGSNNLGKHLSIPVSYGMKLRVVGNADRASSCVFLTSLVTTASAGASLPVVEGGSRINIDASQATELVVPSDAHYLCFNITSASGTSTADVTPQSVSFLRDIKGELDEIKEDVSHLTNPSSIVELNGKTELDDKYKSAKQALRVNAVYQQNPLMLLHFSDIHGDEDNLKRIIDFASEYEVDDILHTGDVIYDKSTDAELAYWLNTDGVEDILNVIGNHDVRLATDGGGWTEDESVTGLTAAVTYNRFFAPFIDGWGVTKVVNKCYYYKDYPNHNGTIRLIVLDVMHYDATQKAWLSSVLSDAKTNGYHTMIAQHCWNGGEVPVRCQFTDLLQKSAREAYTSYENNGTQALVQSYIDEGLKFVCYLVGHTHLDCVAINPSYPKQIAMSISNACAYRIHGTDYCRVIGDRSQDLFNMITIEPYNQTIKVFRVGANRNRYDCLVDSLVLDYANGRVLYGGISDEVSKDYVDGLVGNINTILTRIVG